MLYKVILSLAITSSTLGQLFQEKSQEPEIEGKALTWQYIWDILYFNKTSTVEKEDQEDYDGGNITIMGNGGDFFNPQSTAGSRQDDDQKQKYTATMLPDNNVLQIKLTINRLDILPPDEGECFFDKMEIIGANPGLDIPTLCGSVSDQILYIDIDNSDGPYQIILTTSENRTAEAVLRASTRYWDVKINYLRAGETVPNRCLQYHTTTSGSIKSFNYGGEMLNGLKYAICFAYVVGRCDVAFRFTKLNLGNIDDGGYSTDPPITEPPVTEPPVTEPNVTDLIPIKNIDSKIKRRRRKPKILQHSCGDDYLLIGDDKYCGDISDTTITAEATNPIIFIGVRSGDYNDMGAEGFSATYMMIGC